MATAVSVVADVLDVARARLSGFAGTATRGIQMQDRPGVLAGLAGALGEASVSIDQMLQEGGAGSSGLPVDIVMLTHEAFERDVQRALRAIAGSDVAAGPPRIIRVQ